MKLTSWSCCFVDNLPYNLSLKVNSKRRKIWMHSLNILICCLIVESIEQTYPVATCVCHIVGRVHWANISCCRDASCLMMTRRKMKRKKHAQARFSERANPNLSQKTKMASQWKASGTLIKGSVPEPKGTLPDWGKKWFRGQGRWQGSVAAARRSLSSYTGKGWWVGWAGLRPRLMSRCRAKRCRLNQGNTSTTWCPHTKAPVEFLRIHQWPTSIQRCVQQRHRSTRCTALQCHHCV